MQVTEVNIKLVLRSDNKLLAFACITIDNCFVVRDIKIIQGKVGHFVAMPSRKITGYCTVCRAKNHLQANFCNACGKALTRATMRPDTRGRTKLHADIAHPINAKCRQEIHNAILQGYEKELSLSKLPGYVHAPMDDDAGPEDMEVQHEAAAITTETGDNQPPSESKPADPVDTSNIPEKTEGSDDKGGFGILG